VIESSGLLLGAATALLGSFHLLTYRPGRCVRVVAMNEL
jgi:hypothetical protein